MNSGERFIERREREVITIPPWPWNKMNGISVAFVDFWYIEEDTLKRGYCELGGSRIHKHGQRQLVLGYSDAGS